MSKEIFGLQDPKLEPQKLECNKCGHQVLRKFGTFICANCDWQVPESYLRFDTLDLNEDSSPGLQAE